MYYYYARGSLMETKTWSYKSCRRGLISRDEYMALLEKLNVLLYKLNTYIKTLKEK